jgi:hypothetical protein
MIKNGIAILTGLLALCMLIWLCWVTTTDAQGAIVLFLFAPGVLGLSAVGFWFSRESKSRWVTYPVLGIVLLFYITFIIPSKYSPAQLLIKAVAQSFERLTGYTPYAWVRRHPKSK